MKEFNGFPPKPQYYALPRLFFSALLPEITDITELKVTLYTLAALYQKPGYPRYVTVKELLSDLSLRHVVRHLGAQEEANLKMVLGMLVKRGTLIHLTVTKDTGMEDIYLLNTESEREAAENIKNGKMTLTGLKTGRAAERTIPSAPVAPCVESVADIPDIFTLYEENIGMLTPIIADGLKEAEKHFPKSWVAAAIAEAAVGNKRNWRYILAVLERWSAEGKSDGTYQRGPEKGQSPDKYIQGKYGHIVQR